MADENETPQAESPPVKQIETPQVETPTEASAPVEPQVAVEGRGPRGPRGGRGGGAGRRRWP